MKKERMAARGIRFPEKDWDGIITKAKQFQCRSSDIVRMAVKKFLGVK